MTPWGLDGEAAGEPARGRADGALDGAGLSPHAAPPGGGGLMDGAALTRRYLAEVAE